jgi:N-acetylmuramoyl-L-alanine amidase
MRLPVQKLCIYLFCLTMFFPQKAQSQTESGLLKTVVIDAGHGGNDPGAISGGVKEKDLVLSVALRLGNKIRYQFPDVKVVYTRSGDVFVPLYERAAIANKNKADLFISIHANYVSETFVSGTETFTLGLHRTRENLEVAKKENSVILLEKDYTTNYQGFDPKETESYIMFENMQAEFQSQSIDLAANIQDEFTDNLKLKNRGVKQAGFLVLRKSSMPSVLIEIGFISNPTERKFLTSETGKEKVAESVFQAFTYYKKSIDMKSRFNAEGSGQLADVGKTNANDSVQSDTLSNPLRAENDSLTENIRDTVMLTTATPVKTKPDSKPEDPSAGLPRSETTGKIQEINKEAVPGNIKNPKPKTEATPKKTITQPEEKPNPVFFSLQVGALNREIDTAPQNFKGENNIFLIKVPPFFKYYSGKFGTYEEALTEKSRLKSKFPDAFIVIVEKNISRPYIKK